MTKKKYKHIIWDWNGTLLDDAWLSIELINQVLAKRGMPLVTAERYSELFHIPVIEYYRRLGFDFSKESFEEVGTEFIIEYEKRKYECDLQPDAVSVLQEIADAGLTQSILSAYKQDSLEELIDHFKLSRFFTGIIGLKDHYANGKIEHGREWMIHIGHRPHEVLFVGDMLHDFEVAEAIDTDCVLILSGHQPRSKLEKCGVEILESLADLPRLLI